VQPALLSLLDRLGDAPALVTDLHKVLKQNPPSVALIGDQTWPRGVTENFINGWFTEPATRAIYPAEDHPGHFRVLVCDLRAAVARGADNRHAADLAASLCQRSLEFTALRDQDQGPAGQADRTRFLHPSSD
jgi:MmyB-like transcription regulator ligand binding domain